MKATFEDPIPYAVYKYIEELEAQIERLRAELEKIKAAAWAQGFLQAHSQARQALEETE